MTIRQLIRQQREKCDFIAAQLRFMGLVTEDELAAYYPGGTENPDKGIEGWIFCRCNYTRFCDRIPDEKTQKVDAGSEDEVIRALADTPEVVQLTSGNPIAVYPKSFITLQFIERCDARIDWLARKRKQLIERDGRDDLELTERVSDEMIYEYGVMAWVATTPGPSMPFSEIEQRSVDLPTEILALSTIDLLSIRNGFVRVNAVRLHALVHLMKDESSPDGPRPTWKTFFATGARDTGVPTASLMRDSSLVSQVASSILVADAERTAMEAAKRGENRA